jgi:hypothetical protein
VLVHLRYFAKYTPIKSSPAKDRVEGALLAILSRQDVQKCLLERSDVLKMGDLGSSESESESGEAGAESESVEDEEDDDDE